MTHGEGSLEADRLDPATVEALYACHAAELRAFLKGLLKDPDIAEDVLQATFLRVAERGHTGEPDTTKAWLFQVAHNAAMDRRRQEAAEGRAVRKSDCWKRAASSTPAETVGRDEVVAVVRQMIERLPAEQREVVRLRIYENQTFAQIAQQQGVPLGTALTRMRIATKTLMRALRGESQP